MNYKCTIITQKANNIELNYKLEPIIYFVSAPKIRSIFLLVFLRARGKELILEKVNH